MNGVNEIKSYIMASYRFCKKVFDGGFETPEQFDTFTKLCENHLKNCNHFCRHYKPMFGILQPKQHRIYKDILFTCSYTVEEINDMFGSYKMIQEKQAEKDNFMEQIELRARIEHELAIEYRELEIQKQKELSQKRQIGYNLNKTTNNDE